MRKLCFLILRLGMIVVLLTLWGCAEGTDDYPDAAKVSGYVYENETQSQGVQGIAVILESDPTSDTPYIGPDRWFFTDENGYFEGFLNLGSERDACSGEITYYYFGDITIGYHYNGKMFSWGGGATIQAGGNFICPPVFLTQFISIGSGGG